jgi:hypothetical protein
MSNTHKKQSSKKIEDDYELSESEYVHYLKKPFREEQNKNVLMFTQVKTQLVDKSIDAEELQRENTYLKNVADKALTRIAELENKNQLHENKKVKCGEINKDVFHFSPFSHEELMVQVHEGLKARLEPEKKYDKYKGILEYKKK